ncbi:MAG TPA: large conductance mechanosensitive channel protein MscL [Phycicoccus sp.]|jgi:large conductance mechanosensitive channel|nr:large conductance mechanosensitive channel protein MscL [Phycicoccus sp.]HQK32927.1 large conductance mechanosensitive channel protein MscL [Phycicoccus sp.]HQV91053.1 large conductance mechanosensitive channel protein MscL [Phycicoccus sp.]HRA44535.1 large conductance mechanosensitive channel protein MscL [Phycicoccus sp.]
MKGFKNFLLQGNVVELAVAVIIAGAFGKVVEAVVKFLMDIIALIGGAPNFDSLSIGIGDNQLFYGPMITAIIGFIILAAVVYFVVVKPYEAASARFKKDEEAAPEVDESVELLKEIRDTLRARG